MSTCIECGKELGFGEKGLLGLGYRCSQCQTNEVLRENALESKSREYNTTRITDEERDEIIKNASQNFKSDQYREKRKKERESNNMSNTFWAINFFVLALFSVPEIKGNLFESFSNSNWWIYVITSIVGFAICLVVAQKFREFIVNKFPKRGNYAFKESYLLDFGTIVILLVNIYLVFDFNAVLWVLSLFQSLLDWFSS